ncbi:glycosyltransferase family 10 domain-containing protein [Sulfurimonas indica]|uniref:glycosyltransferase family 10 domain-containing protein n=1 Tax=Sulfurimonas indica TaxID=2508707 RepID=UPI001263EA2D|nr:glycosyltransferase family 10 [Sulfurimonas indica]
MLTASFIQTYNLGNKIFDIADNTINRDNYGFFYFKLKEIFKYNSIDLSTYDINKPNKSDIIIYNGLQQKFIAYDYKKSYLLLLESPHVDIGLVDKSKHKYFKKIFTWNDDMIDNKKYFKINYAFDIPETIPKEFQDKKLCCAIAGNKFANHPDELYTKRVEFIRWFEKTHPEDFDLYGTGWDQYRFGHSFLGRVLNKFKFLRKKDLFPSYKGMVDSKFETMQNYKFAICYENIKDQNGYITEKIFDCFFAGCIPIYWGAKNVTNHIPKECFIDKREFDTFEELYEYMINMDEKRYFEYLNAIEYFLNSPQADPFRAEVFAETIVNEVMKDLQLQKDII